MRPDVHPVAAPRRETAGLRLQADYRALTGIPAAEMQAARERWIAAHRPVELFADTAARYACQYGNLRGFYATGAK